MSSIRRSYALLNACRQVVSMQPSLMVYPFVSLAAVLGTILLIVTPATVGLTLLFVKLGIIAQASSGSVFSSWQSYVVFGICMLLVQFAATICNLAFYEAADASLRGEYIKVREALARAWSRKWRVLQWVVFSTIVGFGLSLIRERLGIFGKIFSFIGSLAWGLATIFAVPLLIRHDVSPFDIVKNSADLFKKTWGENVVAGLSLGVFVIISLFVLGIIPGAILVGLVSAGIISIGLAVGLGAIAFLLLVVAITYLSTLQTIFTVALLRYAEHGDYVGPFTQEMLAEAFVPKPKFLKLGR